MVNFVPNLSVRNPSNIRKTAHIISNFYNKGSALKDRLVTVLNDFRYQENIRNLDQITLDTVKEYTEYLQDRLKDDTLSRITTANYVSALNSLLKYSEHPDLVISAKEAGLSKGTHIPLDLSNSQAAHQAFIDYLAQKAEQTNNINYQALQKSVALQRELGLRFRESISIKQGAIRQALKTGNLNLTHNDGTKNGRPRDIPLSEQQTTILQNTYDLQKTTGYKSLVDPNLTRNEYTGWVYREIIKFQKTSDYNNYHFHGNRHEYAHQRYEQLWQANTGTMVQAPVVSGYKGSQWQKYVADKTGLSVEEIKKADHEIREAVSNELGHNRVEITRDYLG